MIDDLAERYRSVRDRVDAAARAAGRSVDEITTIVVTKFQPIELVEALIDLGVHDLGESRHQEARVKAAEVGRPVTWHFVGQLQGKKARQVSEYARVVHSVDRLSLVQSLGGRDVDVFAQVNLSADPERGGVAPEALLPLAEGILATPGLRLLGVMGVPPLEEEPATAYERLYGLSERVRRLEPTAAAISGGMSGDFETAIAHGATHLRIGTAITGERPSRA